MNVDTTEWTDRQGSMPVAGPRRRLACALALSAAGWPLAVAAHHGYVGRYDFERPMYLRGPIVAVQVHLPHARLAIAVPRGLALPRDRERLRPIEDAEARPTLTILQLLDRHGRVDVRLDGRSTERLIDEPDLVREGLDVEIIVYRRITADEYRDELMVALLRLPDGRVLVSSTPAVGRAPSAWHRPRR